MVEADGVTGVPSAGTMVPHFTVITSDGETATYSDLWQRTQLLLVILCEPQAGLWADFVQDLLGAEARFGDLETAVVLTAEPVWGASRSSVCVADRWGEVTHAAELTLADGRVEPGLATLLLWAEATLHRCPECEGEAR